MSANDERIEIVDEKPKRGLMRRYLTGTTSLVGSVTSVVNTVKVGADAIGGGMEVIAEAAHRATAGARVETFAQACERLGVTEKALPRIHNQILVQLYATLCVMLLATGAAVFYVLRGDSGLLVPLICVGLALGSGAMWVQSSLQAMQIRERKLGLMHEWMWSPSQWLPARLSYALEIPPGDSRRDQKMTERLASQSRRYFAVSGAFVLAAVIAFVATVPRAIPGASLLACVIAALAAGRAISVSCLVLQSRDGRECDLLYWLARPSRWVP